MPPALVPGSAPFCNPLASQSLKTTPLIAPSVFTVTVSVLLGLFKAPPPATEAVLMIEAGALAATFTVSVRVLELPIPIVVPLLLAQETT